MLLAISREYGINENWLRKGEGSMFIESDGSVIDALVSELSLDEMAKSILMAYKKLDGRQHEGVSAFIQALSQAVLAESIARAHDDMHNEIVNFNGDGEELHDRMHTIFANEFPFVEFTNEDTPQPSVADTAIRHVVQWNAAMSDDNRPPAKKRVSAQSKSEISTEISVDVEGDI